ncbi:16S rRNA (uracil(1498)-N(3))-methyltransferase [Galactobacter caseinivorans]|uniref:Ribosomal RNA small subunit methyltransferase E n=1 Tax=Galactobacter caseinivorans TaxID=2676123 RepID=A0A496PKW1_9MICC|nr:16S rRNA (uracil(1498)-N(3))-methyltransferase [Galactobacter caseinivorans]RKW71159.1 16S rRNA (uracil(1498)-N(3))-methyltransferase [Galactobacter caseinivorans]
MSRQSFLDPAAVAGATAGSTLRLSESEARHARVKRIQPGEGVDVVDGAGSRWVCTVLTAGAEGVSLRVDSVQQESRSAVSTVLVQALAKGDRDLQAVETCVEIGIDAVIPWQADRSIVRWREERAAKAHAKWENQVVAAVKQSRRDSLPPVEELHSSSQLERRLAGVVQGGGLALVLHESATRPLTAATLDWVQSKGGLPTGEIALVVGPEGGISAQELERFETAGAKVVHVGTHVLRASTAGAVALVLVRSAVGAYSELAADNEAEQSEPASALDD